MRPAMAVFGAEVAPAVPFVAVTPPVGVEVSDDVPPPIRVGDGTTLPVRVMVAVCNGRLLAAGDGLGGTTVVAVTPLVAVAAGRVGVIVIVGVRVGVNVGKSKTEVVVLVAATMRVGSLGGGNGLSE